MVIEIYVIVH